MSKPYHVCFTLALIVYLHRVSSRADERIIPGCHIYDLDADIVIGGIFPVHVPVSIDNCDTDPCRYKWKDVNGVRTCLRLNKPAITWVQSMLYAISEVNRNRSLLPGFKLGYLICDSLNNVAFANNIALQFHSIRRRSKTIARLMNETSQCVCSQEELQNRFLFAVIGGASSKISRTLNYILSVDNIPQISYSSTSPSLADKQHFRSFLRTIPSDTYQGKAIADIVQHFNWTYVAALATLDDYGRLGIEAFKAALKNSTVCFSIDRLFDADLSSPKTLQEIQSIVSQLKKDTKANVVVLFTNWNQAEAVLQEAARQNLVGKTWIASEAWGNNDFVLKIPDGIIGGMLGIIPWSGNIGSLRKYIMSLRPWFPNIKNIWLKEYWEEELRCGYNKSLGNYTPDKVISSPLETILSDIMSSLTYNKCAHVMDALLSIANVLQSLNCSNTYISSKRQSGCSNLSPGIILNKLKEIDFIGTLGMRLQFNDNGDPTGNYLITNLQRDKTTLDGKSFEIVGHWVGSSGELFIHRNKSIMWNSWTRSVPRSVCSLPCSPGFSSIEGASKCCWKCVRCHKYKYKSEYGHGQCKSCKRGFLPFPNQTACFKVQEMYQSWKETSGQLLAAVSLTAFALLLSTFAVFLEKRNTALIKASNRELQFFMLANLTLMSVLPLLYIGRPSNTKCILQPVGFGICFVLSAAILLVRTSRYVYIFYWKNDDSKNMLKSVKSQFCFVGVLAIVPSTLIGFWFSYFETGYISKLEKHHSDLTGDKPAFLVTCNQNSQFLHLVILGYVALIGIICSFLAYRARNLPENLNETRWLGITMFALVALWSSVLSLYHAQPSLKEKLMSWTIISAVYVIWGLMFLPKLIIIVFYPEKNTVVILRNQVFKGTLRVVSAAFNDRMSISVQTIDLEVT